MPREVGPERAHFGGEHGLITQTVNGKSKYFWRCTYCDCELGGKCFPNKKARIHLSGDSTLRNAIIAKVCPTAPDAIKKQFTALVLSKRAERSDAIQKRKRAIEVLNLSPVKKLSKRSQSKLRLSPIKMADTAVHDAWGLAFFALDIPANKISTPLFREAMVTTQRSSHG